MKQALLILIAGFLCTTLMAQQIRPGFQSHGPIKKDAPALQKQPISITTTQQVLKRPISKSRSRYVDVIDMGTSGDAFSYGWNGGQRSILQYNPYSGKVVNFHRMGGLLDPNGNTGDLGYDISYDLGETFTTMIKVYEQTEELSANFPQFDFLNSPGKGWSLSYLAATQDGSNHPNGFGGYITGLVPMGSGIELAENQIIPTDPEANHFQYIPEDMVTRIAGDMWAVDINQDWSSGVMEYTGHLLVIHGTWNKGKDQLVFEEFLLECPIVEGLEKPFDAKIAFSPMDENIGFIAVIGNNGELAFSENALYPIVWKTNDGGQTWSEPFEVQIGGPDGIEGFKTNLLHDNMITYLFYPPYPSRDEIVYTTCFDLDITVDMNNKLHIATGLGVLNPLVQFEIITESSFYSIVDLIIEKENWEIMGLTIDRPKKFRSNFYPEMQEDNRIQIGRAANGNVVAISYLDTQAEFAQANNLPDILCRGIWCDGTEYPMTCYDMEPGASNVTFLSDGMETAYFMNMSDNFIGPMEYGEVYIPFSFMVPDTTNPYGSVQYKYVRNFFYNTDPWNSSFQCGNNLPPDTNWGVGIEEDHPFNASANHPNPVYEQTSIDIDLPRTSDVTITVYNEISQLLYKENLGAMEKGIHTITLHSKDLQPGLCLYTISVGDQIVKGKMIVQ